MQQKNAHIIIFDIHSEYKSALTLADEQKFSLNYLDVEKLRLPYWLMNREELESIPNCWKKQNAGAFYICKLSRCFHKRTGYLTYKK